MLHAGISDIVIGSFYKVYNTLGYGFLEKVYENALALELQKQGLPVLQQHNVKVFYEGHEVGDYFADMVVSEKLIIELKATEQVRQEHVAQLTNYLRGTQMEVGLLLNFGRKAEFKRIVYSNDAKAPPAEAA